MMFPPYVLNGSARVCVTVYERERERYREREKVGYIF